MSDGIGCVCAARSEYECCCDADWRPQELIDLQQQLASRDAEVAELQKAIDDNWVTHQQIVAANKERDQLREQVTLLRDALLTCSVGDFSTGHVIHPSFDEKLVEEALAATEPKL